ncbi:hypothetical protein Taro_003796 [Colocasia esculenta]|uniref:Protein kinase domain-containing protein n=1 Tax=Colocasia esculenta TaxID=4460 RepID=A0A843TKE0_COLES|nr:hypothetical protein [Colocasia esculenta]
MERKGADPPPPPIRSRPLPVRPALATLESNLTSSTSSSSSSSFSPPDFLRHVQAALKRHRPIGLPVSEGFAISAFVPMTNGFTLRPIVQGMHANGPRARRVLVSSGAGPPSVDSMSAVGNASSGSSGLLNTAASDEGKGGLPSGGEVESTPPPEDNASVTPPSSMGRTALEQNSSFPLRKEGETRLACDRQKPSTVCPDAQKKVHSSLAADDASTSFQSAAVTRTTKHSGMGDISSHMTSLGLAEQGGSSRAVLDPDLKQQDSQPMEMSGHIMTIGDTHLMDKRAEPRSNLHFTDPMTQGSVASSSFTALSLHAGQAQCTRVALAGQTAVPTQMSSYAVKSEYRVQEDAPSEVQGMVRKEGCRLEQQTKDPPFDDRIHGKTVSGDAATLRSQVSSIKESSLNVSEEPSQSTKAEKGSRKKKYDTDSFFKVNGKFYQKLGKIGSGGSSEVYKVITSDCTIYALKRIVLKGRDYSTACGFYQEIEYLKKLKGKSNIIQLIDYEVQTCAPTRTDTLYA